MTDADDVFYPDDDPTIMPEGIKHFFAQFSVDLELNSVFRQP